MMGSSVSRHGHEFGSFAGLEKSIETAVSGRTVLDGEIAANMAGTHARRRARNWRNMPPESSNGLSENVAGLLCYVLGIITGVIFLLIDKRPWVRFQAAQSIVVFGGLFLIRVALIYMSALIGFGVLNVLGSVLALLTVILWVVLMVKAYKHETFRVPVAAEIADGIAGNNDAACGRRSQYSNSVGGAGCE
jgi:uncharacterized membrane protein